MPFDLNTGNTAFMLIATSLVMLMTPGLAFFYGGLVGRKNVLTIMMQSFVSMGITTRLLFVVGYSMCFSGDFASGTDIGGIIGNFNFSFFNNISIFDPTPANPSIPLIVFICYQMMFAVITPALITGAFANRIKFPAYLIFLILWLLFVYFPIVHMIWGGGLLYDWGVRDFAGGIAVHNIAGMAALASVIIIGKRKFNGKPHSIPLVALGTGLLWFGWYGFNAGSEFSVDFITTTAFINTELAASFAAIVWLILSWIFEKKPKFVGLLTGAIAGLATITPAAGFVDVKSAVIIGIIAGIVCYGAVALKNKLKLDDALDVWAVHGVGGLIGTILLGVFSNINVNPNGFDGLIYGNADFFLKQLVAVLLSSIYAFGFSFLILFIMNKIKSIRVTEKEEEELDEAIHGESAYTEGI